MKPTPGTAPGTQLSGEVSYFFVSPWVGPPTLTNQRVSSSVFSVSSYILVLRLILLKIIWFHVNVPKKRNIFAT